MLEPAFLPADRHAASQPRGFAPVFRFFVSSSTWQRSTPRAAVQRASGFCTCKRTKVTAASDSLSQCRSALLTGQSCRQSTWAG